MEKCKEVGLNPVKINSKLEENTFFNLIRNDLNIKNGSHINVGGIKYKDQ